MPPPSPAQLRAAAALAVEMLRDADAPPGPCSRAIRDFLDAGASLIEAVAATDDPAATAAGFDPFMSDLMARLDGIRP